VERIAFKVFFQNKDVTEDLSPYILSIRYKDFASSKDDELELILSNKDMRFMNRWFPEKGTKVKAYIGYENKLLPCGLFDIQEIEFSSHPDIVSVRCTSHAVKAQMRRTKRTKAWENTSLFEIVSDIANRYSLKPIIEGEDVPIKRLDQKEESDSTFLYRLAKSYGFNFKILGDKLVFIEGKSLESKPPVKTIKREGILSYRITDSARKIYRACKIYYYDSRENKEREYIYETNMPVGETLKVEERAENIQQAIKKARAYLRKANKDKHTIELELMGDPSLVAGLTVNLSGFGVYDGKHFIESSEHEISDSGYLTRLEVRACLNY